MPLLPLFIERSRQYPLPGSDNRVTKKVVSSSVHIDVCGDIIMKRCSHAIRRILLGSRTPSQNFSKGIHAFSFTCVKFPCQI